MTKNEGTWLDGDLRRDVEYGRVNVAPGVEVRGINMFEDQQVGGSHYSQLSPQPFAVLRQWGVPHAEGEAIYHILRHGNKDGAIDLDKAISYLEMIKANDYPAGEARSESEGKP